MTWKQIRILSASDKYIYIYMYFFIKFFFINPDFLIIEKNKF